MRIPWLVVVASLAIDAVLGHSSSSEPIKRSIFADEDPAHIWSASKYKQLRARALSSSPSPSSSETGHEPLTARLRNVTETDLRQAREIVEQAIEEAAILNRRRLENPQRNNYKLQDGTKIYGRDGPRDEPPPLLTITDEIAEAAALVAEADVFGDDLELNSTTPSSGVKETRQSSAFWMEGIKHRGSWPWGKNPPDFKVFRNVKDYGAKGDGKTDDTKAIRKAVEESGMCGDGCYSSTTHGAIIYFPSGTYLVSSTIEKHYGTQLIGNPNDRPVMKAAKFFVGLGIFSTNKYYGDDQQDEAKQDHSWHINTGIFWGQIRNFVIDITGAYKKVMMTGIHYQVSQATSLQYVEFKASTEADAEQRSIFAENGSGGHMSDLKFTGGKFGIYGGNQQFTGQRITFKDVGTAVQLIWDWGWTWKSIVVDGSSTAFKLVSEDGSHGIGGALIVDTVIKNTKTAVAIYSPTKELGKGTTGLTLDNVKLENVQVLVDEMDKGATSVRTQKVDGGKKDIDLWVLGRSYQNNTLGTNLIQETKSSRLGGLTDEKNPLGLLKDPYFERAKPQYESASVGDFVSTKSASCKGDGTTDDTKCLQGVIDGAARDKKIVFVDAGTYILTDTLHIPPGSRIVGENWAQLAATGSKYNDETKPRAVIRVGKAGDKGTVELQDLIITSKGETPGALFIEWNLEAEGPGKAAMWEVHVRVGGTDGSGLTSSKCPPVRSGVAPGCKGGSMMMHLTKSGSAYVENAWLWVADHDLDDPTWVDNNNKMTQTSIYVARGFLVESTKPSWLYGTSSEHSVYYQYEFFKAANVLAGMIQTEQPYYQPTPPAPAPFDKSVGTFRGDPPFRCTDKEPCDSGWSLRVIDSSDITILGAGLYSWFSTYTQDCLATSNCQRTMAELAGNKGRIVIHNLVTIGAANMMTADSKLITAKDNRAVDFHPFWSQLSRFEAREFKKPATSEPVLEHGDGLDPIEAVKADLSTSCSRSDTCVDPKNTAASSCGSGYTRVGYDYSDCWFGNAKIICCKSTSAPKLCLWRANLGDIKTDCNGRCDEGEVPLYESSYGGGEVSDSGDGSCTRGHKTFCCKHNGFSALTSGCEWVQQPTCFSAKQCPSGKASIANRVLSTNGPMGCRQTEEYCCPQDRTQLSNCHWVGQGDCADVSCNNKEITLAIGSYGEDIFSCNWMRKKSLCCTPNLKDPQKTCGRPICQVDPWLCPNDEYALQDGQEDPDVEPSSLTIRDLSFLGERQAEGGSRRKFNVTNPQNPVVILRLFARIYDGPSQSYGQAKGAKANTNPKAYRENGSGVGCGSLELVDIDADLTHGGNTGRDRYDGFQMDHRIDLQYLRDLVHTFLSGFLMSGEATTSNAPAIPYAAFEPYWNWNNALLPFGMRQITPTSPTNLKPASRAQKGMQNVNNRLFEVLGGNSNRRPLILLEANLNRIKGAIFHNLYDENTGQRTGITNPIGDDNMLLHMNALIRNGGSITTQTRFFQELRSLITVWRYIRHDEVLPGIQDIRRALRNEITIIEAETRQQRNRPSLAGLTAIFDEFDGDWWETSADHSRSWIERWINAARIALANYVRVNSESHPEAAWIEEELQAIWREALRIIQAPPPI